MTLQLVSPQCAPDSASTRGDSADDASSDPGQSSTQCSLACDFDDDGSWITPQDMVLLKAVNPDVGLRSRNSFHQRPRVRRLPEGTRPLRLVGEGAANAVFQLDDGDAGSDLNDLLLLRVAKVPSRDYAPTYNYLVQQRFYEASIKPRLGEYAVHQELVILHKSGVVDRLNRLLQDIDSTRKKKFRGSLIGQTDWGFLVEDMRPQDPTECVLIEFKPKWLSQSPSAPKDAIRCRQCAMELRNLIRDPSDRMLPEHKPCPLALVDENAPSKVSSPFRIAPHLAPVGRSDHFGQVLGSIVNHPSIRALRAQQDLLDKLGPLYAEPTDPFLIAMTLRDCTCFAQIHRRRQSVKIRMGDFDWKDPLIKFDSWRRAEQELIDGRFYTAERILCNGSYYHPPTFCALEFSQGSHSSEPEVLDVQARDEVTKKGAGDTSGAEADGEKMPFSHKADVDALQKRLERFKMGQTSDLATAFRERLSLSPR
ncbi:inositol-pentakisphosphate 2-kinase [Ophiocordyceps sinensis CO18]|uniref:Inositol-pentakisphosphate 2-kinase n=1 Tax=Ophiocordyceps sinensis (strain Co18 / CGMCC 3.14243) TaxID=911162 RepID=T5ALS4_OPHSC|nr:inositol-pentakisphosphate 2-kinase [Ophiocordyceps sinensis CO18]